MDTPMDTPAAWSHTATVYLGRYPGRETGLVKQRYSSRSWFAEIWLLGFYVGIAR